MEIVVSLKDLSNVWRTLDIPLINCAVPLTLNWSENCLLTDITTEAARTAQADNKWTNKRVKHRSEMTN